MVTHGGDVFGVARSEGWPWQQLIDFSASINPLGPSPLAREAILCALDRIAHYPDRDSGVLREALAASWKVPVERLLVGNGATDLLFEWCRQYPQGTIAVPAFSEFHRAWPEARYCALADPSTWPAEGAVVLTRPANPTGLVLDRVLVREYAQGRKDAVLVDESFLDFTSAQSAADASIGNLFVLRSLTKFWALPGLRIGALIGDVERMGSQRPPWPVNALAEAAALASLGDESHAAATRALIQEERSWMVAQLAGLGLSVLPSEANYLAVETEAAAELVALARSRQVLVRNCGGWPGWKFAGVRVAVRKRWENEILIRIWREFLDAGRL